MGVAKRLSGRCLCGSVTFVAEPKNADMGVCHCEYCRRWTGGVFMSVDCGTTVQIDNEAALSAYRSSEWGERLFCSTCGTSLFWRGVADGMTMVSMQAFENPGEFRFASEIFVDQKPANYDFANETYRMTRAEFLAAIAAQQEAEHG